MGIAGDDSDRTIEGAAVASSRNRWYTISLVVAVIAIVLIGLAFFAFRPAMVPQFVGTPASDVASNVAQAGFTLGSDAQVATANVGAGIVLQQRPAAGSSARRRSAIDVTSSVAPVKSQVPAVTGTEVVRAQETLSAALFVPLVVDEFIEKTPAGTVIEQFPIAQKEWMTGQPVALGVSVGPDDGTALKVPNLMGMTPEEVGVVLDRAGLTGNGIVRDLGEAEANEVVAQLPQAGTLVRPETTVLMYFVLP
jgi:serine/threonine-protein kinase